mmetsp:Transcript_19855/g.30176  ORF Transcript_19855/g.30176 Transcript_19855/m.30176 type:complete len:104 (-) Transcript_19855:365-676(-)
MCMKFVLDFPQALSLGVLIFEKCRVRSNQTSLKSSGEWWKQSFYKAKYLQLVCGVQQERCLEMYKQTLLAHTFSNIAKISISLLFYQVLEQKLNSLVFQFLRR